MKLRNFSRGILSTVLAAFGLFTAIPAHATTTTTVTLIPVADSYVTNNFPTTNYGSVTNLYASATAYHTLLKFDTSSIPSNATITNVDLKLYNLNTTPSSFDEVHPEGDSWTESGVTWNNQPTWDTTVIGTAAAHATAFSTASLPTNSVTIGANTNYGVGFSVAGIQHQLTSKEWSTSTCSQLVVTYTTP
jgi:hypothetical protein